MNDVQRQKAYDAEFMLRSVFDNAQNMAANMAAPTFDFFGSMLTLPDERKFGDVAGVQRYADMVLDLNWVRGTWEGASEPISVRARKGQSKAHYCAGEIAVPVGSWNRWALREIVVLHEIAHHLAKGDRHGPDFAATHLVLVTEVMGDEAGLIYRWAQDMTGVKSSFKRLPVWS